MFDLLFLVVIGLSIAFAVFRGGLQELATVVSLAIAAGLTWLIAPPLLAATGLASSFFGAIILVAVLAGVFFLAAHIGAHFSLKRLPLGKDARRIDRIAGGVFGAVRGLVLIGLGYLGYSYYLDEARQPDGVRNALTRPLAAGVANWFESFAPEETRIDAVGVDPRTDNAARIGYDRADRQTLDEVVATVTTSDDAGDGDNDQ